MAIKPKPPRTKTRTEVLIERIRAVLAPSYPVTCQWCGHGHEGRDVCPQCRAPQRLRADLEAS